MPQIFPILQINRKLLINGGEKDIHTGTHLFISNIQHFRKKHIFFFHVQNWIQKQELPTF